MAKIRYKTFNAIDPQAMQKTLEEYGDAGWRLVAMTFRPTSGTYTFIMEREVPAP